MQTTAFVRSFVLGPHRSRSEPAPTASAACLVAMPPPRTRSASAAAAAAPLPDAPAEAPQNSLLGLPEELLHLVADALLHKHLPSALRLRQASTALRGRLAAVRAAAEARRLRWVPEVTNTNDLAISDEGRVLTRVGNNVSYASASGSLLPTAGRVSFSVRIEKSEGNFGDMLIGVCSAAKAAKAGSGCQAWREGCAVPRLDSALAAGVRRPIRGRRLCGLFFWDARRPFSEPS